MEVLTLIMQIYLLTKHLFSLFLS